MVASGEIERDLIHVTRLDNDDINELTLAQGSFAKLAKVSYWSDTMWH